MPQKERPRYLSAESLKADDFGHLFTFQRGELVYDAKTVHGPWATMTHDSWLANSTRELGTGRGQCYRRADDGKLYLIEGGIE